MAGLDSDFENDLLSALKEVVDSSEWFCVGEEDDLRTCTRLYAEDGEDVVVIRSDGEYYAMDAECSHEGGPMELGDIEDIDGHRCIVCPWHSFEFRLDNGESPSSGLKQQTYNVRVEDDGKVYVNYASSELSLQDLSEPLFPDEAPQDASLDFDSSKDKSLCDWAVRILCTADPSEKVRLTHEACRLWDSGNIVSVGREMPPDQPYREEGLDVVAPGKMKIGKGGTLASRIATIHSLANIEQWAIDLSWDIIARFSDTVIGGKPLPREFFTDFVKVAGDEAKHYKMLDSRLLSLGSHFGSHPVHYGLWQSAMETSNSLLARLAVVHMVHEARGLDVHPKTQERFAKHNDTESVDMLEVIYTDEITHVAAGMKWFTYVCRNSQPALDCIPKFHELVQAHFRGFLKPPFNEQGRDTAGMTKEWYLPLTKPTNSTKTPDDVRTNKNTVVSENDDGTPV